MPQVKLIQRLRECLRLNRQARPGAAAESDEVRGARLPALSAVPKATSPRSYIRRASRRHLRHTESDELRARRGG